MQHINLYLPRFQRQRTLLSAQLALGVWLVLLVFLLGFQWMLHRKNAVLAIELQTAKQIEASNLKLLETLTKEAPQKMPSQLLEQEVKRLEKERGARQAVLHALSGNSGQEGRDLKFSLYLEALARQHTKGLWLTQIRVSESGRRVGVKGKTLDGKLVPSYLQRLKSEPVFDGAPFNTLQLSRSGNETNHLDFTLYSLSAAQQLAAEQSASKSGGATSAPADDFLPTGGALKAAEFISKQLPGAQLIQRLHGGGDVPALGDVGKGSGGR